MSARWDVLGIYLGFSQDEIDKIKTNVEGANGKVDFCFNRVIAAWLSGDRAHVNRKELAQAVEMSGFGLLAEEIRNDGWLTHS